MYRGGLKKCVIKNLLFNPSSISSDNSERAIPEVFDVKIAESDK